MPTTPALSFLHAGQLITNPFLSPDGLHPVDPVQAYGFEEHQTGGGCTALVRALENGQRLMLTEVDGCHSPDLDDWRMSLIVLYDATGEAIGYAMACDLQKDS